MASGIWQQVGWGSIIYLSALAGVDQQLYEAAAIDGAGKWKQLLNVTLPGIAANHHHYVDYENGSLMNMGYEKPFCYTIHRLTIRRILFLPIFTE